MSDIELGELELDIRVQDWESKEIKTFSYFRGVVRINGEVVGNQTNYAGASKLIDLLKFGFADAFKVQEYSKVKVLASPAWVENKIIDLLEFEPRVHIDPKMSAELSNLNQLAGFQVEPIDIEINHRSWVRSKVRNEFLLRRDHWEGELQLQISRVYENDWNFLLALVDSDTAYLINIDGDELNEIIHINLIKFKNQQEGITKTYREWRKWLQQLSGFDASPPQAVSLIDVCVLRAIQNQSSGEPEIASKLIHLPEVSKHQAAYLEAQVEIKDWLKRKEIEEVAFFSRVLGKIRQLLFTPLQHAFESEEFDLDRPFEGYKELAFGDWEFGGGCIVLEDFSYQNLKARARYFETSTLADMRKYVEDQIANLDSEDVNRADVFDYFQQLFSVQVRNFAEICALIESLPEETPADYTNDLWNRAYEVRETSHLARRRLELELAAFEKRVKGAESICKKLAWPNDWPPLIAVEWMNAGGRKGSAHRWKSAGWNPVEVLTFKRIIGAELKTLAARLNMKNPPQRLGHPADDYRDDFRDSYEDDC